MGIVSVLIALFLPALARVREQANRVKCAANLRSIGHAMTMYVQQSGYYPCYKAIALTPEGSARFAIWPTRLRVFMNGAREPFYCPSQDERCRWEDGNIPAAARGRADATLTNFGYELGERLLTLDDPIYFSYGYNFGGWASTGSSRASADWG